MAFGSRTTTKHESSALVTFPVPCAVPVSAVPEMDAIPSRAGYGLAKIIGFSHDDLDGIRQFRQRARGGQQQARMARIIRFIICITPMALYHASAAARKSARMEASARLGRANFFGKAAFPPLTSRHSCGMLE